MPVTAVLSALDKRQVACLGIIDLALKTSVFACC